jgi:hypothetical protein
MVIAAISETRSGEPTKDLIIGLRPTCRPLGTDASYGKRARRSGSYAPAWPGCLRLESASDCSGQNSSLEPTGENQKPTESYEK